MTSRLLAAICLALAVILPGCAALEQAATYWSADDALAVAPEDMAASELERGLAPAAPAAVPPPAPPAAAQPPRPTPKPVELARTTPSAKLERVFGLSLGETRALLGTPYLQREAPPAKVLAYDGKICTLNVFFYLDLDSGRYRALSYEIKGGDGSEPAKQRCLSEIFADGSV
jgi:hypothetical protein